MLSFPVKNSRNKQTYNTLHKITIRTWTTTINNFWQKKEKQIWEKKLRQNKYDIIKLYRYFHTINIVKAHQSKFVTQQDWKLFISIDIWVYICILFSVRIIYIYIYLLQVYRIVDLVDERQHSWLTKYFMHCYAFYSKFPKKKRQKKSITDNFLLLLMFTLKHKDVSQVLQFLSIHDVQLQLFGDFEYITTHNITYILTKF